jgi:hypothetical protein
VLGGLAALFAANAQFGTEPAKLSLVKVRDDVYVIRNPFVPGNTTAVITAEGVILVDASRRHAWRRVASARQRMVEGKQPGLPDITVQPRGAIWLGGKSAEIYWMGRAHTDGDVVVLFPQSRVLVAGDMYTHGEGTPQLVDYAGGGSAKEWTATVEES